VQASALAAATKAVDILESEGTESVAKLRQHLAKGA